MDGSEFSTEFGYRQALNDRIGAQFGDHRGFGHFLHTDILMCPRLVRQNPKGNPIATVDEIPDSCGVMVFIENRREVIRIAPKKAVAELPFSVWMALAKANRHDIHIENACRELM